MKVRFLRSFDESNERLENDVRQKVENSMDSLLSFFENGEKQKGLGLKKLRDPYWEIRAGIRTRVLFSLENDILTFIVAGNHDQIRRFLRR